MITIQTDSTGGWSQIAIDAIVFTTTTRQKMHASNTTNRYCHACHTKGFRENTEWSRMIELEVSTYLKLQLSYVAARMAKIITHFQIPTSLWKMARRVRSIAHKIDSLIFNERIKRDAALQQLTMENYHSVLSNSDLTLIIEYWSRK